MESSYSCAPLGYFGAGRAASAERGAALPCLVAGLGNVRNNEAFALQDRFGYLEEVARREHRRLTLRVVSLVGCGLVVPNAYSYLFALCVGRELVLRVLPAHRVDQTD
jgi:hypothetical protein